MNSIKTFKKLQLVIAGICLFIPAILFAVDATGNFRPSISNYVYMNKSYVFGMLLCMAAMLFIFNSAFYSKMSKSTSVSHHGKWYNIVLGVALIGVIVFPHLQYPAFHYTFAGIFFLGNSLVIGLFHKKKDRTVSRFLSFIVISSIAMHYFGFVSLLVGEWISLATIGTHFILQSIGIEYMY